MFRLHINPPSSTFHFRPQGAAVLVLAGLAVLSGCQVNVPVASTAPSANAPTTGVSPTLVTRGAQLAAIGNCAGCHTANNGSPYAGGFPVRTPFGTVHGTNLTPDTETGLGQWSEADFRRALREGVGRHGEHLYPAFPYTHFTLLADDDVGALFAFFMTRDPVRAEIPANTVIVPRAFVALWKKLYFHSGRFRPDPAKDARLMRGEYLAEALAHCSACHTPRNALGAQIADNLYDGGDVGGWHAPALNTKSTSPVPWTTQAMTAYLQRGIADMHAIAAGPMREVVRNLGHAPDDDVAAIALYSVSLDTRTASTAATRVAGAPTPVAAARTEPVIAGARIYAGACADCHDRGRDVEGGALQLALAIAPTLPTPANLIHIIRDGIVPQPQERTAWMPPFAGALTAQEIAGVVIYLRAQSGYPPWSDVAGAVARAADAKGDE